MQLSEPVDNGHSRTAQPRTLAALVVFDALLADVVKSLRCSRCGQAQMLSCGQVGDKARRLINLLVIVRPLQRGNHVNLVVNQQLDSECQVRRHGFYPAPISRSDL
jgi:hypothetical protein